MHVGNRDSRGWKTRRKDSVGKGQGVTHQSPLTAARAQRAPEHDEDGGWTGFSHIPQALHHTPRMVVFAHLSSKLFLLLSLPERVLSRLLYLLSSQKGLLICTLTAMPSTPGIAPGSLLGQRLSRPAGYETQKLPRQIPWKADRAYVACPSHPQCT